MFKNNKKGLAQSILVITIVLFMFAVTTLFAATFWTEFSSKLTSMSDDIVAPSVKSDVQDMNKYILMFDKLFIYLFIGMWLLLMISSVQLPVDHPVFFLVFLAYSFFVTLLAMAFVNIFDALASNSALATAAATFPIIVFFMSYYHIISFTTMVISGVVFYLRSRAFAQGNIP